MPLSEDEIKEIAAQLRKPYGEKGIKVAESMFESNAGMIQTALDALHISRNENLLELGYGNGSHLNGLFDRTGNLEYFGLEMSELMHQTAVELSIRSGFASQCEFLLYDGENIPFQENTFDKVLTVNTLFFWDKPENFLKEIKRVMRSGSLFSLCFRLKSYMQTMPFTRYNFRLYDLDEATELCTGSEFNLKESIVKRETTKSVTGEMIEREYACLLLEKP